MRGTKLGCAYIALDKQGGRLLIPKISAQGSISSPNRLNPLEVQMADVLVVTSKVKKFIKEKGDCNTSAETVEVLSKAVEQLCQKGIDSAKADGRKTVMARDVQIDHL